MDLEWDPRKAAANLRKHGVSFHEAGSVLSDTLSTTFPGLSARGGQPHASADSMKKASSRRTDPDMRPEYDFAHMKGGVRGKYAARFNFGVNLVLLEPEVAKAFPSDKAVNEALRTMMRASKPPKRGQRVASDTTTATSPKAKNARRRPRS